MLILAYLFGLLCSVVLAFLIYLINGWLDTQIHTRAILFIIPLGGLLIGGVVAFGLGRGKRIFQKKIIKLDIAIAIILGLFSYFFIDYISYYTTYINEDDNGNIDIVTSLSGKKGYIQLKDYISYSDYTDIMNSSSSMQFRYRGVKVGEEFEVGKTGTIISLILQILGVIIGAGAVMLLQRDTSAYCDGCKKYKKTKLLKTIDPESMDSEELNTKMKQIYEFRGNMSKLKGLLDSIKDTDSNLYKEGERYFTVSLIYCESCHSGDIIISHFVVGKDGSNLESSFPIGLLGVITPLLDETGNSNQGHNQKEKVTKKKEIQKKANNEKKKS